MDSLPVDYSCTDPLSVFHLFLELTCAYLFYVYFTLFLLKILCRLLSLGKWLSNRFRNFLPMFVETFLLNGGLNHMIFRFLFRLCVTGFSNFNLCSYPALCSASWYSWAVASNCCSLLEMFDYCLFIDVSWMVRSFVYVRWCVVWLSEWSVWFIFKIKSYIEEVYFLLISVVTLSPNPWNTFVISLALWLASVSDWFLNTAKPSSL